MVNQQLISFIRQSLSQGYNINDIRGHLVSTGYNPAEVEEAINSMSSQPAAKPKTNIPITAIIAVFFIAIIAGGAYYFLMSTGEAKEYVDIQIKSMSEKSLKLGSKITFQYDIWSLDSKKLSNVDLAFNLVNRDNDVSVVSKESTVTLNPKKTQLETMDIPMNIPPGSYFLTASATYKDVEKKASPIIINVIKEGTQDTCFDGKKNQDETNVDCGGVCKRCETCSDDTKNQDETDVDCGGVCTPCISATTTTTTVPQPTTTRQGAATTTTITSTTQPQNKPSWEILQEIHNLALTDPEKAGAECMKQRTDIKDKCFVDLVQITGNKDNCLEVANLGKKDSCYLFAASKSGLSETCADITSDSIKDQCYMTFVLDKEEYELCDKITNIYEKRACEGLKLSRG